MRQDAPTASVDDRPTRTTAGWRPPPDLWWLAGIVVVATALAWAVSRHGISPSPDGTLYLGTASNIADGRGITVPFTTYTDHYRPIESIAFDGRVPLRQWPPLFPAVIGAFSWLGWSPGDVVRVLNPLLLGVNVALLGLLARRLFRTSWLPLFGVLATIVVVRVPDVIVAPVLHLHSTSLAEPLFTLAVLACLLALDRFLVTASVGWLCGAAVLAGAASATKLLGLSAVATVCLVALIAPGSLGRRAARTAVAATLGLLPVVATLLSSDRRAAPAAADEVRAALNGAVRGLGALIPGVVNSTFGGVVALVLLVGVVVGLSLIAWRIPDRRADARRIVPLLVLAAAMIGQLVYSVVFVDRFVSLVGRQMTLPLILLSTATLATVSLVLQERHRVVVATVAAIISIGVLSMQIPGIADVITTTPPPTRTIRADYLPSDGALFSNAPDAVFLGTGRTSYMVPCRNDYFSGASNPTYDDELEELVGLVASGRASVLLAESGFGFGAECAGALDFVDRPEVEVTRVDDRLDLVRAAP